MFNPNQYKNQYNKETYYNVKLRIPKEKKSVVEALAETTGKSINRIFIEAVEKQHHVDLTLVEEKLKQP